MDTTDDKGFFRDEVATARRTRDALPSGSHVRAALTDAVLNEVTRQIDELSSEELDFAYTPAAYGLICSLAADQIVAIDSDIDLVLGQADVPKIPEVTQFLRTKANQRIGEWYGGLFDLWVKATLIKTGANVTLDVEMPNGRNHDVGLTIGTRRFHIESTVLSEPNETREAWDRYTAARLAGTYSGPFVRLGLFCSQTSKVGMPYSATFRLYLKVFDKIAGDFDPKRSQFADDEPNILLISLAGSAMRADYPGIRWGLDELFIVQPRTRGIVPEGITDISLESWVEFEANTRIAAGKITVESYCKNRESILTAPRRLSAILLFDGCTLAASRVNYNAKRECRVSHSDMVALEGLLTAPARYFDG